MSARSRSRSSSDHTKTLSRDWLISSFNKYPHGQQLIGSLMSIPELTIKYITKYDDKRIAIFDGAKEIGHYVIEDNYSTTIYVDEDPKYRGKGLAKLMVACVCLKLHSIRPDTIIMIDADASQGFWDHIGFINNRYGYDYRGRKRDLAGRGYEKTITFAKLSQWALGAPLGDPHSTVHGGKVQYKKYVVYEGHRYVVRKNANKNCIVVKGVALHLIDIHGAYRKC